VTKLMSASALQRHQNMRCPMRGVCNHCSRSFVALDSKTALGGQPAVTGVSIEIERTAL
jgi:hypothetical protein